MSSVSKRKFGFIKWFGGVNNKTGRENNFGFVTTNDGTEFYLHRNELKGTIPPTNLQPVAFFAETQRGRFCCRHASPIEGSNCTLLEIFQGLQELSLAPSVTSSELKVGFAGLRFVLVNELHKTLRTSSKSDIEELLNSMMAAQLTATTPEIMRSKVIPVLEVLPLPLLITILANNRFSAVKELGSMRQRIDHYLGAVILGDEPVPDYLVQLAGDPRDWKWLCGNPMLQDLLDRHHFKKSLAARGTEFLVIYARTPALAGDLEYFILYEIFSLIIAGNLREVVYNVFLQRLWSALVNKQVDLFGQQKALQSLFPSCEIMGPLLSCEAFFWKQNDNNEDMFLCRSKRCNNPQILPQPNRKIIEYTLYDWLNLWDFTYENASKPRSRDFPIRIAGYFNRLREIYERLHCRACAKPMVPHMDYARTSYKSISNGEVVVQQLTAAYRLTVFRCNERNCKEHGNNYYINHCIGLKCHEIIDSRDLKHKCSAGRYICNSCGSCCQQHSLQAQRINEKGKESHAIIGRPQSFERFKLNETEATISSITQVDQFGRELVGRGNTIPTLEDILGVAWPDELDR